MATDKKSGKLLYGDLTYNIRGAMFTVLFFLSGFSALIYEVVWLRKLELVFGTTTYAVSTVIAVFFSGLALGSWLFGKFIDQGSRMEANHKQMIANERIRSLAKIRSQFANISDNPLLLYGLLELGIGVYAALTPWIFKLIESVQVSFWQSFQPSFSGFSIVTFVLATSGLILPTILMGGTLPVVVKAINANRMRIPIVRINANERIDKKSKFNIVRAQSRTTEQGAGVVGWLYGLNTLGAVMGVLAAGFFLIATIGVNQTIWAAAGVSLAVGLVALWLSRIEIH